MTSEDAEVEIIEVLGIDPKRWAKTKASKLTVAIALGEKGKKTSVVSTDLLENWESKYRALHEQARKVRK